jgi:hypothetical protein
LLKNQHQVPRLIARLYGSYEWPARCVKPRRDSERQITFAGQDEMERTNADSTMKTAKDLMPSEQAGMPGELI